MGGRLLAGALAVSTAVLASPGWAGGAGGFHGGGFRPPMGHPPMGGAHGFGGGGWRGGAHAMPPIAGIIHERAGMRPYYSAYGHTATGYRRGGFGGIYGAGGYAPRYGSGYAPGGFGHVATGFRRDGFRRYGYGRERFAEGRRFTIDRYGRGYRGYGGYGGGYGGGGFYDGAGLGAYGDLGGYGTPGTYGTPGLYGSPGTYGTPGTYGSYGTQAGGGGAYLSEPPLAATRTEAPLAPSPYGPDGGYYAPGRAATGPHILTVDRSRGGCGCGSAPSAYPAIYRYGVGTAY